MRRSVIRAAIAASVIVLSLGFYLRLPPQFFDFRAFYCAGQAELAGADPYREHPLHECEQRVSAPGLSAMTNDVTAPAPFPGFVLGLFALLAALPFPCALAIWIAAACLAIGFTIVLVAGTTRTPITANLIAIGFPAAIVAIPLGQLTPFVALAVAGSASMLERGRPRLAALAALGAMLDPHVGLALVLGIFVCVRRARGALIAGTAALVAVGVLISGPAREWEYLWSVIPAHALANVADATQFSATNIAFVVGLPPAAAIRLGSWWYVGTLVLGVWVAWRLRARFGIAAVAYLPPAFAVFGGSHSHLQQLAIAVPAFMLVNSTATGRRSVVAAVAGFVAAMPWLYIAPFPTLFFGPALLAVGFAQEMKIARQGIRLAAASVAILSITLLCASRTHVARTIVLEHIAANPLAQVSWGTFMLARFSPAEPWYLIAKTPTMVAFLTLLGALIVEAAQHSSTLRGPRSPILERKVMRREMGYGLWSKKRLWKSRTS